MTSYNSKNIDITSIGAKGDGTSINTTIIQSAIDHLAAEDGGTVTIPAGVFVSGALFFKHGVDLKLEKDAVLRCSTDMTNFPEQRTRIEGHFEDSFNPALINADNCDGMTISGEGTLDGAGKPIWDEFWKQRKAAPDPKNFKNLAIPRARLALIENSKNVTIKGITFKDSQFWNLHIYKCDGITVDNVNFIVPDNYVQAPSTDGIDLDSTKNVAIKNCYFSVTDDCIGAKGTKGPFALDDLNSPPVENITISNCIFKRGSAMFTCGSEATSVHDVIINNCQVKGRLPVLCLKLRPDTPQCYENIKISNIKVDSKEARIFHIESWKQYFDLQGQPEPASYVRNISVAGISGTINHLGTIEGNSKTILDNITLKEVDVTAESNQFKVSDKLTNLTLNNIKINNNNFTL